jgi:hypothetical protein
MVVEDMDNDDEDLAIGTHTHAHTRTHTHTHTHTNTHTNSTSTPPVVHAVGSLVSVPVPKTPGAGPVYVCVCCISTLYVMDTKCRSSAFYVMHTTCTSSCSRYMYAVHVSTHMCAYYTNTLDFI